MRRLIVDAGKRYLAWDDGAPFFYMGDTAWELFHCLTREEAEFYLSTRAKQGFTAIQAVALAEFDGLRQPNAYGRTPLISCNGRDDPLTPDLKGPYSYWDHVDYCVDLAARLGLFITLLPTWGDKFHIAGGQGPEIFTPENAAGYGAWIGRRYRDRWNIIWMLGGDRPLPAERHRKVIDAMAQGIRQSDPNHLITFHPVGGTSSLDAVPGRQWLDFHSVQTGHGLEAYRSFEMLARTRQGEEKPFLDAEPRYEDHPACFNTGYGYFWDAADARQNAYWDILEGACGHTYGNHSIWRFNQTPQDYWPYAWREALTHPGAQTVPLAARLRLSRPYFDFRPAPELVDDDPAAMAHISCGRGEAYAFAYTPLGQPVRFHGALLGGKAHRSAWFDPRTGETRPFALTPPADTLYVPPDSGKGRDWVLIVDRLGADTDR